MRWAYVEGQVCTGNLPYHFQHFVPDDQLAQRQKIICHQVLTPRLSAPCCNSLHFRPCSIWFFGNLRNFPHRFLLDALVKDLSWAYLEGQRCTGNLPYPEWRATSTQPALSYCLTWLKRKSSIFLCQAHSEPLQLVADPLLRMFFLHVSIYLIPSLPSCLCSNYLNRDVFPEPPLHLFHAS